MKKNKKQYKGNKEESYSSSSECGRHDKTGHWITCKHVENFPVTIYFNSKKTGTMQ